MTCIAAIVHRGRGYIGADSLYSDSAGSALVANEPKCWITHNGIGIGVAGSPRILDLFRWKIDWPDLPGEDKLDRWAHKDLLEAIIPKFATIRETAPNSEGLHFTESGIYTTDDLEFESMIVVRGRIWHIDSQLSIAKVRRKYHAIGSGGVSAAAVLCASEGTTSPPLVRLETALKVAEKHHTDVRRPWTLLTI